MRCHQHQVEVGQCFPAHVTNPGRADRGPEAMRLATAAAHLDAQAARGHSPLARDRFVNGLAPVEPHSALKGSGAARSADDHLRTLDGWPIPGTSATELRSANRGNGSGRES